MKKWLLGTMSLLCVLLTAACGDGASSGAGSVRVLLTAEETITDGLDKGEDVENTRDYSVRYSKFLAAVGHVTLARSLNDDHAELSGVYVVDMKKAGSDGIELGVIENLEAGEWDKFGFATPAAKSGAKALDGVSASDLAEMVEHGWTYWIEGTVERAAAEGGPVAFTIQTDVPTVFTDCEYEGEPGVTVVEGGKTTATITLHGDHIFFNAFPVGSEGSITRLAGWVIQADADGDGKVVTEDLLSVDATTVFTTTLGYRLDGAPIPLENALDFVRAQLATQGHYKGEGECIWHFEGATGEHDHNHDHDHDHDHDHEACSGHGELHDDHCHCDEGFHVDPANELACMPSNQIAERLVVADPTARQLHVYELGSWKLLASFEDVVMNDHAGFVPLEDGRLLFVDTDLGALRVVNVANARTPTIGTTVPLRGHVAHLAVDPHQSIVVTSGTDDATGEGVFTLVNLHDLSSKSAALTSGEPGVALGGDPLMMFHRNDAPPQFEMYAVDSLWDGTIHAVATAPVGTAPHGEVIAHHHSKLVSAADDGIHIVPFTSTSFGQGEVVPYDVDGLTGGRAFYARLSSDGRYVYSYLRDSGPEGSSWGAWRSDAYIVDLQEGSARRLEIGNGLVYRLAICPKLAAFAQYHPDGDFLHLLDADPSSETFHELVARVPLAPMTKAPAADGDVWASVAFRVTALSTDCRWAFVTHGGDGAISIIDTQEREVVRTLDTASPLNHGGYVISVRSGIRAADTIGR